MLLLCISPFTKQKFKVSMPWVCCAFDNVCIMYSPRFGLCIMAFQCFWSTRRSIMASTTWKCSHWLPSGSESVKEELQGSKNIHLTFSFEATRDTLTVSGTWPDNLCLCFDLLNAQNSLRTSDGKKNDILSEQFTLDICMITFCVSLVETSPTKK